MENRHTLHISKLEDFKKWLENDGWEIEEPKGIWEVLRARKQGRKNPLIVFQKKDAKEHLSIMDRDSGVIGAFLKDCKKPKTNADHIREMSDDELAEFLPIVSDFMCNPTDKCRENIFNRGECEKTKECALKWLQSEVEK